MADKPTTYLKRTKVDVRINAAGLEKVDKMAKDRQVSRSEMIRVLVSYGIDRMPPDYGSTL